MKITVKTGAWADKYVKGRSEIDLPENATVTDAITALDIPIDDVGFAVINSVAVRKDHPLKNETFVTLHPAIMGG